MEGRVLAPGNTVSGSVIAQVETVLRDDKSIIANDSKMLREYIRAAKNATGPELQKDLTDEYVYGRSKAYTERNRAMLKRKLAELRK